jgi:hypothetical protein
MAVHRYWQVVQNTAGLIRKNRQSPRLATFVTVRGMTDPVDFREQKARRDANREVEALVTASGRTQSQVADYLTRRLGRSIEHYHVSRMINGQRKVASDEMDALRELAAAPTSAAPVAPNLTATEDVVPLFGYANGAGTTLRLNEDARVGVVPIHPAQRGSRQGGAFITFGDSVAPRLLHGEIAYYVRGKMPYKDQLALIELTTGEAMVKFYDRQDKNTLFTYGYDPYPKKAEVKFPLRDILAIHAVVGSTFGPG